MKKTMLAIFTVFSLAILFPACSGGGGGGGAPTVPEITPNLPGTSPDSPVADEPGTVPALSCTDSCQKMADCQSQNSAAAQSGFSKEDCIKDCETKTAGLDQPTIDSFSACVGNLSCQDLLGPASNKCQAMLRKDRDCLSLCAPYIGCTARFVEGSVESACLSFCVWGNEESIFDCMIEVKSCDGVEKCFSGGDYSEGQQQPAVEPASPVLPTPPVRLETPTGFTATPNGTNQIDLSWFPPDGATTYKLYRSTAPGVTTSSTWVNESQSDISFRDSKLNFHDTGLTSNTRYYYTVMALNAEGLKSALSVEKSAMTLPNTPGAPVVSFSQAVSTTQIDLRWDAVSNFVSYNVYKYSGTNPDNLTFISKVSTDVTPSQTASYHSEGLNPGTKYYFKVSAVNRDGEGPLSAKVSAITWPLPVTGLSATATGPTSIHLTWTSLPDTGDVWWYHIYRDPSFSPQNPKFTTTTDSNDSSVASNTTYSYYVKTGSGEPSVTVSATTLPSQVTGLTATTSDMTQINLSWNKEANGEASYKIYRAMRTPTGNYNDAAPLASSSLGSAAGKMTYSDTGLTSGNSYKYSISALGLAGEGTRSAYAEATTPPPKVANLDATASGPARVNLRWSKSTGAEEYYIYRTRTEGETKVDAVRIDIPAAAGDMMTYSDTILPSDETYNYKVSAFGQGGEGEKSEEKSVTLDSAAATISITHQPPEYIPAAEETSADIVFTRLYSTVTTSCTLEVGSDPATSIDCPIDDATDIGTITVGTTTDGSYKLTITATNTIGFDSTYPATVLWTVDRTPPTIEKVTSLNTTGDSRYMNMDGDIIIEFSEPLQPPDLSPGSSSILLSEPLASNAQVPFTASYDQGSHSIKLTPGSAIATYYHDKKFQALLRVSDFKDMAGNKLEIPYPTPPTITVPTGIKLEQWGGTSVYITATIDTTARMRVVSAGSDFSLALKWDGTVWAWGNNESGQLGDGTTTNRKTPVKVCKAYITTPAPSCSAYLTNIAAIAGGYNHSLALKDGTVWVWGNNSKGQLGLGDTVQRHTPIQVSSLTNITAIAAGLGGGDTDTSDIKASHSLALKSDGTVLAWGNNSNGQLGDGTTIDSRSAPVQVCLTYNTPNASCSTYLTGIGKISAGYYHSLAIKDSETTASAWGWGRNNYNQLGKYYTPAVDSLAPVRLYTGPLPGVPTSPLTGVTTFSGGYSTTLAIRASTATASVWACGTNMNYQLGIPGNGSETRNNFGSIPIGGQPSTTIITAIMAREKFSLALKGGTVWTWGLSDYMGLAQGTGNKSNPVISDAKDSNSAIILQNINAIAAGGSHSLALKSDGTVLAWGDNDKGQLGDDSLNHGYTPVIVSGTAPQP